MAKSKGRRNRASLRPRLRVMVGDEIALGPGRVDLLELIEETGSLRAAARRMGVSYMRAWNLIKYTNKCFREPVIEVARGGKTGGGAKLTKTGQRASVLYRKMEKRCCDSNRQSWADMRRLLLR